MVSTVSFFNMDFKIRGLFMNRSSVGIKILFNFLTLSFLCVFSILFIYNYSYSADSKPEIVYGGYNAFPIQLNYRQINLPSSSHLKFIYVPPSVQVESKGVNCRSQWYYSPSDYKDSKGEWLPNGGIGLDTFIKSLDNSNPKINPSDISCINGLLVERDNYFNFEYRNINLPLAEDANISSDVLNGYLFKTLKDSQAAGGDLLGSQNNTYQFNMYYINSLFMNDQNNPYFTESLDYFSQGNQYRARYKTKVSSTLGSFRVLYNNHLVGVISFNIDDGWLYTSPKYLGPIFSNLKVSINTVGKESEVSNIKLLANAFNSGEIIKDQNFYPANPSIMLKLNLVLVCTNPDPGQVEACSGASSDQCYVTCDSKNIPTA